MKEQRKTLCELEKENEVLRAKIIALESDNLNRKKTEEALKISERRFKAIADYTYEWECWHSPDGRLMWVNPAVERVTGYTAEECMVMNDYPFCLIHPDEQENCRKNFYESVSKKTSGSGYHFRIVHKNGAFRWMSISWQSIYDENKVWLGFRSSIRDITEQKEAESNLRASEKEYRELVQNARTIILRMDMKGNIIFFNEFARDFFGFSEHEIIGKNVIGTIVPHTDSAGKDLTLMIDDILRNPHLHSINENENIKKNGETVWISWSNRNN